MMHKVLFCLLASILIGCTTAPSSERQSSENSQNSLVDERYELVALVFRLAGRKEYSDISTDYQREIVKTFSRYSTHPAVTYAKSLPLGYDAVFRYSMFINKADDKFVLGNDIRGLIDDGRWTAGRAEEFTGRLNRFYTDSSFSDFFQSHRELYGQETMRFADATAIDYDWFLKFGKARERLHVVVSPSNSMNNYSATVADDVFVLLQGGGGAVIHEFCHSFANPIAHDWYKRNPVFRKTCDESVNLKINPQYSNGWTMSGEYVTRSYTILYYKEHGYKLYPQFARERQQGFPKIETVYSMIDEAYHPDYGKDWIAAALETKDYSFRDKKSITFNSPNGKKTTSWRMVLVNGFSVKGYSQTEVGNVFKSNTGDVLYVEESYLLIDLGGTSYNGRNGYRSYCRISK